ncbi:MAG: cysteine synthase family protein [Planctomycetes bacterium]|nr:cysteine synthase family protein [Planctomycetota bacterium]
MPPPSRLFDHVGQAVGGTPLVAIDRLAAGLPGRVAVKLEYFSPGASIKDRPALTIIERAEQAGLLKKGQYVVEKTSGNMGGGLAWACAVKGYKFVAVLSAGNTPERSQMIEAFGAKVVKVPQAKGGKPGLVTHEDLELVEVETQKQVKKLKAFRPDQFDNPNSSLAHEIGTGPEIWAQTGGSVTHFCSFVGSSGTLIGTSKALKAQSAKVQCYAVEPEKTPFLAGKKIRSTQHTIQGGGYAVRPGIYDDAVVDGYLTVTDAEAKSTARALATKEGIMGGFSGGANVAAAIKLAREAPKGSLVVTVICDSGLKYLSTDLY